MNFEQRVELAQDRLEGGLVWGEGPVLDELDAAIVLVGHSYRRDAHHYDTHNPAVIGPLGRVMFAAVAPMFTRSQSRALYIGHPQAVRDELARYGGIRKGWRRSATVRHVPRRRCSLGWRSTSSCSGRHSPLTSKSRAAQADEDVHYLPPEGDELNAVLGRYELWSKHSADEDIIELRNRAHLVRRVFRERLEAIPDSYHQEAKEAALALRNRMAEIEGTERHARPHRVLAASRRPTAS